MKRLWKIRSIGTLFLALLLLVWLCGPAFGTALSADKKMSYTEGQLYEFPVDDGDTIYAGAMVSANAAGYAIAGADTACTYFLGISREYVDNSAGSDGDLNVTVQRTGVWKMLMGHTITQANVGDYVYILDDNTADVAGNTTNDIFCGVIVDYIDGTHAWVDIGPAVSPQAIISPYMLGLLDDADEATFKATTNLEIGTDVEAYDAGLTNLAAVSMAADKYYYTSADNVHAAGSVTAFGRSIIDDADEATFKATTNLEIGTDVEAWDADLDTYAGITPTAPAQTALGNAVDALVLCQRHRVTVAEINAGHEILPAIVGKSYRMVQCMAIAYGGAVGTTTTVDLLGTQAAGSVKLVAYAQASLTQSAVLVSGGTGAAVQADAASYSVCDAGTAITVGKTGGDADTATGVDIILMYVIE